VRAWSERERRERKREGGRRGILRESKIRTSLTCALVCFGDHSGLEKAYLTHERSWGEWNLYLDKSGSKKKI
tara:strand:- start:372 stop:587 length:216 start_codon:yes stop_codon:yes gene_type:complete